jgi:predicted nucleic acid-binding protein
MAYDEHEKTKAVSNTGPMISAFQCAKVDLLKRYFDAIYIVSSQLNEFERHGAGEQIQKLIREGFIIVASDLTSIEQARAEEIARRIAESPSASVSDYQHHLPEAETMVLMQRRELNCQWILLDEKAAREVAEEIGLNIIGFPGVLGRAGLDGLLSKDEIRRLLTLCQQQGTRYSNALIEHVAQTYGR